MYTISTEIEATLNQQPLTYLDSDPSNLQAITSGHLAIGRALRTVSIGLSTANLKQRFASFAQTLLEAVDQNVFAFFGFSNQVAD